MEIPGRRREDTGKAGEGFFKLIAGAAGLVVNAAHEDRAGWDFQVESPSFLEIDFASRSRPQYQIQVKSAKLGASSVSLTYSSLLSLIDYSGPAFVLLLRFGSGDAPQSGALLRRGEAQAIEVLTALRRKQVAERGHPDQQGAALLEVPYRV